MVYDYDHAEIISRFTGIQDDHNHDKRYVVKFIAEDGSLIAWDADYHRSVFVNHNDRDQLKAYDMKLS